jgi:hypothetical protein
MVSANDRPRSALLAFAAIKEAVDDFDRGDSNLFVVLDRIRAALSVTDWPNTSQEDAA